MKISVNKVLYHWYSKVYQDWTSASVQVSLLWKPEFGIEVGFTDTNVHVNLFNLFIFQLSYTKKEDHAGFESQLNILGLDIEILRTDTRHWDYDNDCWENDGTTIEEMNEAYYQKYPERK